MAFYQLHILKPLIKRGNTSAKIELIETKRDNIREQLEVYNGEKTSINEAIAELRKGLANNTTTYKDRETGQILTRNSSSNRKALEKQLDQSMVRQTEVNTKLDDLNTKIFDYESEIIEAKIGDGTAGELGPLKYLSGLTGIPMDKIINYLLLIIIFVFDPLAISLVIAANFAFEKIRPKEIKLYKKEENWIDENQIEEEEVIVEPQPVINPQIKNLENELVKVQKSGLIEKRRNEGAKKIQTQINKLKKDDNDKTITY